MIDCSLPLNILCNVIHFLMITACMSLIIDHSSFSNDIDDVGGLITRKDLDLCILHCVYRFFYFFYFFFIFGLDSYSGSELIVQWRAIIEWVGLWRIQKRSVASHRIHLQRTASLIPLSLTDR